MLKKKPRLIENKVKILVITSVLGWLVYILGAIADGIFAGQQSSAALAGVEIVAPFYSLIMFIPIFFSEGSAILFSHSIGKGDTKEAHKIFGMGLATTMTLSCIIALCMWLFKTQLIGLFADPVEEADIFQAASDYYDWFIGVAIAFPLYYYTYRVICEDADVIWTLASDISQMVVNLILSAILIRAIGVRGLGLSTFISIIASTLVAWIHFFSKKNNVKLGIKFDIKQIGKMITLGAGKWLCSLYVAIVDLVLNAYIAAKFGAVILASYAVVNFVINFGELFASVSGSISGFVTIADAQKNKNDLINLIKIGKKWEYGICIFFTVLLGSFCWAIPYMYGIDASSPVYQYCWIAVLALSLPFVFFGFLNLYGTFYASLEKPFVSVLNQTNLQFVFPLGLSILLSLITDSYYGIIIGLALASPISFLIMVIYLKSHNKSHKIVEYPECNETQFAYDLFLTDDEIISARDNLALKLKELNVSDSSINKSMVVVEDLLFLIKKENSDSSNLIVDRLTIGVSDKQIRIINRDSGKNFDVYRTGKNERINNVNFVLFTQVPTHKSIRNNVMMSFNSTTLSIDR